MIDTIVSPSADQPSANLLGEFPEQEDPTHPLQPGTPRPPWTDPLFGLAAFLCALVASVLASDMEVFNALLFHEWNRTRPLSIHAIVFWSCGFVGAVVLWRDRKQQVHAAREQEAAWKVFTEKTDALKREIGQAKQANLALEEQQREAHRLLEEARAASHEDREARGREEERRRNVEEEHRKILEQLNDRSETLPPSTFLEHHSMVLEHAMNLASASLRTQKNKLDAAVLNDRIRTVLYWMAEVARLYLTRPGSPRAVFGAHISLYFGSWFHLQESGWQGMVLPALNPGKKQEWLAMIPELSSRLDSTQPAARDPMLQPAAWPVELGARNDPRRAWVPGPQDAFMNETASHYDDLRQISEWGRHKLGPNPSRTWRKVEEYCVRQNGCGMRSLVSYPLSQYHAPRRRLHLGALTIYATVANIFERNVRAERLESLLVPFRVIIADLLIRRAQLDETRLVRYATAVEWHEC